MIGLGSAEVTRVMDVNASMDGVGHLVCAGTLMKRLLVQAKVDVAVLVESQQRLQLQQRQERNGHSDSVAVRLMEVEFDHMAVGSKVPGVLGAHSQGFDIAACIQLGIDNNLEHS